MSARNQKLALIVLLFSVAGGLGYRQFHTSSYPGQAEPNRTVTDAPDQPGQELYIRKMGAEDRLASNGRDPFSVLRVPPPAPRPPEPRFTAPPPPPTIPEGGDRVGPVQSPQPQPIALQPIPLLYTGYARDDADRMIAFLETNGSGIPSGHYNLRESDFLLGRYRVNRITADAVEVEDIDRAETAPDRKRTITISPSIARRK